MVDFLNNIYHNLDLNLYSCGIQTCKSNHSYGPAIRDHYLIHFIIEGQGTFKLDNKSYELHKNQGFLIEPNILTYYKADSKNPWKYIWVGFNGVKATEYMHRTNLCSENPIFTYDKDNKFKDYLNNLLETLNLNSNKDLILTSQLYNFIYLLAENYPSTLYHTTIAQQRYIEDAVKFIENNFANEITINDISKYINIDRSYLHKLFKQYLNKSPQQYLIEFRIKKSCYLIKNSSLKIGDIARSVGYKDVLLFSKTFKKLMNTPPSQYR